MLTLTGPGGIGKTRLALQIAATWHEDHENGPIFVALAAVREADGLMAAVAQAAGIVEPAAQQAPAALAAALGNGPMLLVLDNCEHLRDAVAPVIAELLSRCPALRVLVTSRAPLHVASEYEFPVPPLVLPAADVAVPDDPTPAPAITLFLQRARAIRPDYAGTAEDVPVVAAICRRVDGVPLALELAASRARVLPPAALLARLERRVPVLSGGQRDQPERKRTMHATVAWSHDLLDAPARVQFRRLAVFSGGFTLEAAEALGRTLDGTDEQVLDRVEALVEQSLVRPVMRRGTPCSKRSVIMAWSGWLLAVRRQQCGGHMRSTTWPWHRRQHPP